MPHRTTRRTTASALVALALAFAAVGCSSDGSDGASTPTTPTTPADEATTTGGSATTEGSSATTAPEAPATTAPAPTTTTTSPSGGAAPTGDAEVIEAFTTLRVEHCTGPTPEPIGTEVTADGQLVMVDNEGNRLVVDANEGVVHGLDGPDGELPAAYAAGCDPDVFVGATDG